MESIVLLALGQLYPPRRRAEGTELGLLAKCWDISRCLCPKMRTKKPRFTIQRPSNLGFQRQCYHLVDSFCNDFSQMGHGTWQIGSGLLKLTWTSYFDDFLSLTPGALTNIQVCVFLPSFIFLDVGSLNTSLHFTISAVKFLESSLTCARVRLVPLKSVTLKAGDLS